MRTHVATTPNRRASWFGQNFTEGVFADGVRSGELALPVGEVPEPFVDVDDVADVVVVALTSPGRHRVVHEVTGPTALTFDEAAAKVGAWLVRVPLGGFIGALRDTGVPDVEIDLLAYLFSEILDGRNTETTDAIERALGRPPRTFDDSVGPRDAISATSSQRPLAHRYAAARGGECADHQVFGGEADADGNADVAQARGEPGARR